MTTSDFSLFRERLAEACRLRNMTAEGLCRSIGLGGRRAVELHVAGIKAIDIYRLAQIADALGVSIDWLLGRTDEPELARKKEARSA
ncbi:MAG: helix-turn-helix domain-containing protein [Rhodomicrobium sp.]